MSECKSGAQHDSARPAISHSSWCSTQQTISDIVIGPLAQGDNATRVTLTAHERAREASRQAYDHLFDSGPL